MTLLGCVDPFEFQVTETAKVLVVESSLTNERTAHMTRLSYTFSLETSEPEPASGALVTIEDGNGNRQTLQENTSGVYQTDSSFAGVVGESYTLHIALDGQEFISSTQVLPVPAMIDSVYGRYFELPSTEDATNELGVQLFVDATATDNSGNYRFEYEETYEIRVPFPSFYEWSASEQSFFPREESVERCFKTQYSEQLLVASASGLSGSRLSEFPLRFINEEAPELRRRYSILVKQFSISSETFGYYRDLQENNESAGSFFDSQKGTIPGNLQRVGQPEIPVLGYFEVAGVTQSRRFFQGRDFVPQGFTISSDPSCGGEELEEVPSSNFPEYFRNNPFRNIIFFTLPGLALVAPDRCSDCRLLGELEEPTFWEQ